jgi:hypothetical protein
VGEDETTPPQTEQPQGAPQTEEELRAQLEEELKRVRVEDVVLQSTASIVNLTARRIAKEDERDLDQARVGIEAVRALLPVLPAEVQDQLRNALSELQVLYAREAGGGQPAGAEQAAPDGEREPAAGGQDEPSPPPAQQPREPGARRPPPKLWTPPGSS